MSSANKFITDGAIQSRQTIDPLILDIVILLVSCVFTVLVCLFGIAANIVNLLLFRKLGYQDGVNVTLTALAISDLGGLIFELVYTVMMDPYILEVDLVVFKVVTGFITGFMFEYFTRFSGVITANAALERFLCVTCSLKVKTIITNKDSVAVNWSIFILHSMYLFPQFYTSYFDWTYVPERNKTVYVIYLNSRRAEVFPVTYYVTDMILPYSTYIVLITCCTTLCETQVQGQMEAASFKLGSFSHHFEGAKVCKDVHGRLLHGSGASFTPVCDVFCHDLHQSPCVGWCI
ncbi:hypothetical protein BgiBS90_017272 [Biomphalaria glabrata]|nr:hypothetical protein BgiBS90_017272 [Biomphalaria glabrata]